MLYCQPQSFYDEMKYISDNRPDFMKSIEVSHYKIPDNVENIDPLAYLIKMAYSEPETYNPNRIFAIRTYGTNNSLVPNTSDRMCQTYYGTVSRGSLFATRTVTDIDVRDGVIYYLESDEHADEYEFTLDEIASNEDDNPYSIPAYIRYHQDIFEPNNLMAKIPVTLLPHLV